MSIPSTIGLPRMMKEPGEKRVFLPEFVQFLAGLGLTVFVEEGYGSRSGYTFDNYQQGNAAVRRCPRQEVLEKDLVLVLRSPLREEFMQLRRGACLITMLHFPTRPRRVERLQQLGVGAISLDSIVDDNNLRLVENMKAVAWNGLEVAFDVLENRHPGLRRSAGEPIRVLILGVGMVGKHAVEAATKLGNIERHQRYMAAGGSGVLAQAVGRNLIGNEAVMERLFRQTDILVDATQRRDPSRPIVPNAWIDWLPEHAVIADLAVDPYTLDTTPPVVRGIEGIPQGSLDQYVFAPDDPNWTETIPASIPATARRSVVSCYSWPGLHPAACMHHYAQQLKPLFEPLAAKGEAALSPDGSYFERALYRGTLRAWLKSSHYEARPR
jgi:alanine dehydrogenase